ncbi:hypothetical protein [Streptococcus suis]|uniref:hypothetical protein n=1 Tax=Streptococcus suis TaxID=1307 RepID=UPI000CF392D2|nr:hypothetical protein [Streptococcus suis]
MKLKRCSSKKQLHKWAKSGVVFASIAVLGGVVAPVGGQLLNTPNTVYAQEKTTKVIYGISKFSSSSMTSESSTIIEYIPTGVSKTYVAPVIEGYRLEAARASYLDTMTTVPHKDGVVTLPDGFSDSVIGVTFAYFAIEQPVETPVEQPVEQPVETKPTETNPSDTKPSASSESTSPSSTSQSSATKPSASSSSTSPSSTSQSSATNPSASSSSASQSSASKPDETKPTETKVTEDQVSTSPVYRLYHEDLKVHLYTRDAHEYKVLAGRGWRQEGQAFLSASKGSPVYRLYHEGLKVHLYTRDAHEYKVLAGRGWRQEGTAFYSVTDGIPVYRLYNEGLKKHLYTTDANEYKVLATRGWTQEGIAFYSAK